MRKIVVILIGFFTFLFAVTLAIAVVGTLLPAEQYVSRSLRINGSPERVWRALVDLEGQTDWRPELAEIVILSHEGSLSWKERYHSGEEVLCELLQSTPNRRLTWSVSEEKGSFEGTWDVRIQPVEAGSLVTVSEAGKIRNPFFRVMARFLPDDGGFVQGYLDHLDAQVRGGA